MLQIVQIVVIFTIPLLILMAQKRFKWVKTLSPILLAYAIGIVWGNIKGLPLDRGLSMTLSEVTVPIAIPLILFSADFLKWLKSAKKTVISFVLVVVSAFLSALLAAFIFRNTIDEFAKLAGMTIGVYTGGTPNLMAVGLAVEAKESTIVLANACDNILGGAYFLLLISVIKPLLSKILKPFKGTGTSFIQESEAFSSLDGKEKKKAAGKLGIALLICIAALGVSAGVALLITGELNAAIVMLGVTSAGVGLSFVKKVKEIKYTFDMGQYLILAFSIALGTTVNIEEMLKASPTVLGFVAVAMFGAIMIHLIFAILFKIDVDTAIITSVAGVYGPAFIVPVADAIKNREVIVAGLTAGLIGYAVGNYLGILVYGIATLF